MPLHTGSGPMEPKFSINEIFVSICGEGGLCGLPATFIRFSGCNLQCPFCDTQHAVGVPFSLQELLNKFNAKSPLWVVLTGGEPTLQVTVELVVALQRKGRKVAIETNGTCCVLALHHIDYITVSPKNIKKLSFEFIEWSRKYQPISELRYLVTEVAPLAYPTQFKAQHVYFSPETNKEGIPKPLALQKAIEYVKRIKGAKLSLQMHKFIHIP